ncbi:meiotic recombination protein REC8 homolog isoform X1 [Oncorhynchus keta]|uniref:meiotic recombination protein REC8 homolog isoform X1 n=2 Tax=Oncorhynchus keta TaxID=8018 RepID=UPI0015FAA13A|nr:meiotic recombination protein REC8 homolog isoform X1 [Oncorhynchus keta]
MFFSPSVLNRHTGCFSTIWLAATKGIKIPQKDFLKVNVQRTCNDIMDYVLVRVPAPLPGLPRPRFSLYLSSQLQYGVIIVYHRQCGMLLEEIQHILDRLAKTRTAQKIDVDESDRHTLSLPDVLSLLEESEWAANPFFGEIHSGYTMPSPNTLIQLGGEFRREATPERPLLLSPGIPTQDGITASPDSITLIETEPVTIPSAEFEGAELAEVTHQNMGMIDLLMDQLDHFPEGEMEAERERGPEREEREREGESVGEGDLEREGESEQEVERAEAIERRRDVIGSLIGLPYTTLSSEDPTVLPGEETELPMEMPAALAEERTPVSVPLPPSTTGEPEERGMARERGRWRDSPTLQDVTPPVKQPRRRQLLFIDQETQISQEALQQQIDNTLIQTRPLVVISGPSKRTVSPVDLLGNPCTTLPPELMLPWKQVAIVAALTGSALLVGRTETDSESERERDKERVMKAKEEGGREQEGELSSKEVPRDLAESGLSQHDVSTRSPLSLEVSDRDMSRENSPLDTPESRGSPVPRSVSKLKDIPEEGEGPLEREAEDIPMADLSAELLDAVTEPLEDHEGVLFHSLLPPLAQRSSVTHSFWTLLEMVTARRLCVQQDEPYGDIIISPGPNYEEGNESV